MLGHQGAQLGVLARGLDRAGQSIGSERQRDDRHVGTHGVLDVPNLEHGVSTTGLARGGLRRVRFPARAPDLHDPWRRAREPRFPRASSGRTWCAPRARPLRSRCLPPPMPSRPRRRVPTLAQASALLNQLAGPVEHAHRIGGAQVIGGDGETFLLAARDSRGLQVELTDAALGTPDQDVSVDQREQDQKEVGPVASLALFRLECRLGFAACCHRPSLRRLAGPRFFFVFFFARAGGRLLVREERLLVLRERGFFFERDALVGARPLRLLPRGTVSRVPRARVQAEFRGNSDDSSAFVQSLGWSGSGGGSGAEDRFRPASMSSSGFGSDGGSGTPEAATRVLPSA